MAGVLRRLYWETARSESSETVPRMPSSETMGSEQATQSTHSGAAGLRRNRAPGLRPCLARRYLDRPRGPRFCPDPHTRGRAPAEARIGNRARRGRCRYRRRLLRYRARDGGERCCPRLRGAAASRCVRAWPCSRGHETVSCRLMHVGFHRRNIAPLRGTHLVELRCEVPRHGRAHPRPRPAASSADPSGRLPLQAPGPAAPAAGCREGSGERLAHGAARRRS